MKPPNKGEHDEGEWRGLKTRPETPTPELADDVREGTGFKRSPAGGSVAGGPPASSGARDAGCGGGAVEGAAGLLTATDGFEQA